MQIPNFSEWIRFPEYKEFTGRNSPGVYLLANFKRKPSGRPNPLSPKVVYVGETTKQDLSKRLYQFSRSAFSRKFGHSGGWSYSELFLNNKERKNSPENLYVALLAVDKSNIEESTVYIKAIERVIIWEYYQSNGFTPKCNKI
jgi:hypothetical protein